MSKLILCLDGGGIRGAATTQFLMQVDQLLGEKYQKSLRDCVDFYAGNSTGSIIALALANTNMPMQDINELYNEETAKQIFTENRGLLEIDGVNAPKYEASGKTNTLKSKLGEAKLGEAKLGDVKEGKHVLAITYGVEKRKPFILKSTKDYYRDIPSYQVADASSAAPTYFPTVEAYFPYDEENYWLVDGGVVANNPTMCAIAEAKREWPTVSMDELRVLSIGTGTVTRKINGPESRKWGGGAMDAKRQHD
ncbi:patatin-like phospholipase family protein [Marinomonas spartinae]|uniref:patatin-like phospholipase family protein n=1 Tax=Marinomonas spartinae TaxID=1792290 RepID=UPI0018F24D9B|nr:patatin-like phospholipase family protein [Marinomonas spartinae]MBJ7555131.1 patatin-like phospholipase family protein [Marinomonas spartinae]